MFLKNLKQHYDRLSVNEQEVIDYLMRQEEVETITIKTIANELFISSSTVIRACKKLGYQTYNELRYDLRLSKELKKDQAKSVASSFEQMKEQIQVEFAHTISILSEKDFQIFAQKILAARRIFCIGVGSSYMAMTDFNRKLKLINIWSNDYFEQYSIDRIKDIATPKDVIIVFSLGGSNKNVNHSILQAKEQGATVLTITTLGNHLLAKISDHMIFIYDAPKKREKLRSRLMFNLVGNLLFEVILAEQQTN
ncbi:MurR/RpiR family transcriptional regulator [Streptococcus anginosus]|nr:MurR/RpiR family transcriptional regulator [Streptococcus anginosus]